MYYIMYTVCIVGGVVEAFVVVVVVVGRWLFVVGSWR